MAGLTALVLAGGLSIRLGQDKAMLELEGLTLLERVVARLSSLVRQVLVVTSQRGKERLKGKSLGSSCQISMVTDLYPGKGSLGGIYSGLCASSNFHSLVVACDMPFLDLPLLAYMAQQAGGFDVIIPRVDGVLEPLHAIYSKNCLGPMEELLEGDRLKIIDFFPRVRVRYVDAWEIDRFDPHHLSFFNINTPADWDRARELAAGLRQGTRG